MLGDISAVSHVVVVGIVASVVEECYVPISRFSTSSSIHSSLRSSLARLSLVHINAGFISSLAKAGTAFSVAVANAYPELMAFECPT